MKKKYFVYFWDLLSSRICPLVSYMYGMFNSAPFYVSLDSIHLYKFCDHKNLFNCPHGRFLCDFLNYKLLLLKHLN